MAEKTAKNPALEENKKKDPEAKKKEGKEKTGGKGKNRKKGNKKDGKKDKNEKKDAEMRVKKIKTREKVPGGMKKVQKRIRIMVPRPHQDSEEMELPSLPKPKCSDFAIMWLLWSYELIHLVTRGFKASWLFNQPYLTTGRMSNDLEPSTTDSVCVLVATVGVTLAVALFADGQKERITSEIPSACDGGFNAKWMTMCAGLVLYMVTPFIGLLLVQEITYERNVALVGFQIAWYAVTPIRFWFIFHQVFPLEVFMSRLVVATNLCVIGVVEYIVVVFVEQELHKPMVFVFAWASLLLLMSLWLFIIISLLPRFNKVPDDFAEVRAVYASTEAIKVFDARQRRRHKIRFFSLIYPSIMFAIGREVMFVAINQYGNEGSGVAKYNLHIGLSVLIIPVVSIFLLAVDFLRQESRDLISIGFAHVFNLLFFIFLLFIVFKDKNRHVDLDSERSLGDFNFDDVGAALIMVPATGYSKVLIITYNDVSHKVINMPGTTGKPIILLAQLSKDQTSFQSKVEGKSDGQIVFSGNITFKYQKVRSYIERNGKLYLLQDTYQHLSVADAIGFTYQSPDVMALTALIVAPRCDYGPSRDANGYRVFLEFDGNCHSVKARIRFLDERGSLLSEYWVTPSIKDDYTIKPDTVKIPTIPKQVSLTSLMWKVDDNDDWTSEIVEPVENAIQKYWLIDPDINSTHTFVMSNTFPYARTIQENPEPDYDFQRDDPMQPTTEIPNTCPPRPTTSTTTTMIPPELPPWAKTYVNLTTPETDEPEIATLPYWQRPRPERNERLLFPASVLLGFAIGTAKASYIHFLWIQSPYKYNILTLASYFSVSFIGAWMVRNFIFDLTVETMIVIISLQCVFFLWHCGMSIYFHKRLPAPSKNQYPDYYQRF